MVESLSHFPRMKRREENPLTYRVSPLTKPSPGVRHEQGVSVVDGVSQLERKHGVRLPLLELSPQFVGSKSVLV